MAILDEIDSGLDVDALRDVAKAVNGLLTPMNSVLMITHYVRLLEMIEPSYVHVMVNHFFLGLLLSRTTFCAEKMCTFYREVHFF